MDVSSAAQFRISLADALDAGVPPTWHEAVAIVRQLISALELQGPPVLAPNLAQIHILASGAVSVSGGHAAQSSPAAAVGHLLGHLLDRAQPPPPLLETCQRSVATPPAFESLAELTEALAFFARPNPEAEIAAYYARVAPAVEARPRTAALSALAVKARAETPAQGRRTRNPRAVRQAAALALVLAAIASLWLLRPAVNRWLAGPGGGPARSALDTIGAAATTARDAAAAVIGRASSAADAPPTTEPSRVSPSPKASARQAARKAPLGDVELARTATIASESSIGGGAETAAAGPPAAVLEPLPDTAIYSAASAEVLPPALRYPQLPSRRVPGHPGDQPGDLELLVLEDGTVGEARLIPASNRLQDRMLVSAAKAWRFQAASRHGRPVRYRLRIPITW